MKTVLLMVVFCVICLSGVNSFAKEMRTGEIKSVEIASQVVNVHFKGFDGRSCIVDVTATKEGKEIFSENLTFDKEREERYLSIGGMELLIFYVQKGLVVVIDNEEV